MHKLLYFLKHYPFSLLLTLFIAWGSLAPLPAQTLPPFRWSDKLVHLLMYFTLCGVIHIEYYRAHRSSSSRTASTSRLWLWALIAPAALGGLLELAQEYLTTNRTGDWFDFAANTLGCLLAALVAWCWLHRRTQSTHTP